MRPDIYGNEIIWVSTGGEQNKFKILDKEYEERERALCEYLDMPYIKITQSGARYILHKLAMTYGMNGFKYKPYPKDNTWNGTKGLVLFLRVELEKLKTGGLLADCLYTVLTKYNYKGTKGDPEDYDSLYSRYKEAKKNNKSIQRIKNQIESGQCDIESLNNLLEVLLK